MSETVQRKRSLTKAQLHLLTILYAYRFSTRSLLSQYLARPKTTSLYFQLEVLVKHGYIVKRYDSSYKLAGREAEYYVTPTGLRALRTAGSIEVTDAMITALYKDKAASGPFIQQQILLFRLRNALVTAHNNLQYFTTRELQLLAYFPEPRPTGFVALKTEQGIKRCFVEYVPAGTHVKKIKYRLKTYMKYYDQDEWSVTDTPFPIILYVCEDGMTERGVARHISLELYKSDTDIQFYTTSQKALLSITSQHSDIWTSVNESDSPASLLRILAGQ